MKKLELKIPPLLLTVIFAALMWLLASLTPSIALPAAFRVGALITMVIAGAWVAIAGVIAFRKVETTVNPITPHASSRLVTSGIYRYSRNPMYVGFLCALIGWGLYLSNPYSLFLAGMYIPYMTRFQICPEEKALRGFFGAPYSDYQERVRRWL